MTFLLLIFGFILIEMPIVAFLSVVNDVHQPLPILIMALICTVIDVFIITNRITFHKANGGNEERMRKIRKAVKITAIIIAVCLLPGTWFVSEEGYKANRKKVHLMIIIIRVLIHHMIREFLAVQEARVVHRVHRLSMTTPIRMIPVRLIVTVQATTQRKNRK